MLRILTLGLLGFLLLTACSGPAPGQTVAAPQDAPVVTVFKSPT